MIIEVLIWFWIGVSVTVGVAYGLYDHKLESLLMMAITTMASPIWLPVCGVVWLINRMKGGDAE